MAAWYIGVPYRNAPAKTKVFPMSWLSISITLRVYVLRRTTLKICRIKYLLRHREAPHVYKTGALVDMHSLGNRELNCATAAASLMDLSS